MAPSSTYTYARRVCVCTKHLWFMTRARKSKRIVAAPARDSSTARTVTTFFINCTTKQSTRKPNDSAVDILQYIMPIECSMRPGNIIVRRGLVILLCIISKRTCILTNSYCVWIVYTSTRVWFFDDCRHQSCLQTWFRPLSKKIKNYQIFFSNLVTDFYRI